MILYNKEAVENQTQSIIDIMSRSKRKLFSELSHGEIYSARRASDIYKSEELSSIILSDTGTNLSQEIFRELFDRVWSWYKSDFIEHLLLTEESYDGIY
jgi:hypothetical protein